MSTITWTLNLDHTRHHLRLEHGYGLGKRRIFLDGVLLESGRKLFDSGSRHFFTIGNEEFELCIVSTGFRFWFFLFQQGIPIPSDRDRKEGKTSRSLLDLGILHDQKMINELSRHLKLAYLPQKDASWLFRLRLAGKLREHFVTVQKGLLPDSAQEGWSVLVRHAPSHPEDTRQKLLADPRLADLLGKFKKSQLAFEHCPDYTWALLPFIKKEAPAGLAERVLSFVNLVREQTRPVETGLCENQDCPDRFGDGRRLIFINGLPLMYCEPCIARIPGQARESEELFHQAPHHLLSGWIAGLGVALAGALVWAAIALLLDRIAAVVGALIVVWIGRVMDRLGIKPSPWSLASTALLGLFSVFLGNLAAVFLNLLRHGFPPGIPTLALSWATLLENRELLWLSFFFTLLGGSAYIYSYWSKNKEVQSYIFSPKVEVPPPEQFA
jgi:hypothetical protein